MATLQVSSQALPDRQDSNQAPPPPESGIQDKSGFFNRNPASKERIASQISEIRSKHGYRIILLVEPVLIASSASQLAAELQEQWIPDADGIVIVFESDGRKLGFGRIVSADPSLETPAGHVPTHETAAILRRASDATDQSLEPEPYIESLIGNITAELDDYFAKLDSPPPPARSMRLMLLTLGTACIVALAALGIFLLSKLPSMSKHEVYHFPEVERPERLGAPCGGGNVTVRSYREPPPVS